MNLFKRCVHDPAKCRCAFWYDFQFHGRRYRGSTRTANRQLADRIAAKAHVAALEHKEGIAPPKIVKLSAHIEDYLAYTKEHNATAYKDRDVLDRFKTVVGDRPVSDVSAFHIEKWKLARAKEVSQSTVNRELNIVRGCFSRALEWGRILKSPAKGVRPFDVDNTRIRVFGDEELRSLLALDDAFVTLICRTTLESLARLSEVLLLRREYVGPTWIEFRRKGGAVMRAAVTPDLREQLLARCHEGGFIFGEGAKGKPVSEQTASNRIVRALRRLGIKNASHHTARHTGVTLMLDRGENPRAIQALAGWKTLRMLERYGHARDASIRQAVTGNARYLDDLARSSPQPEAKSS